ncbi:MAG: hypothetical protein JWR33_512 [Naasia sp.]|jgi:hypothetical protein|uniref:hypothetical protein n=1 Tax=Naasia sp. TaxID=2546198 RepID=UPI00260C16C9|nr:hypothetical protein [Naasia sp.]MCU1569771.1 hypothetical protein [Naasia sp.]
MAGRSTPPPPDHEDKPVAEDSKARIGARLTGQDDPKDPDGLITLDDVPGATGVRAGVAEQGAGASIGGAAPGGSMPERVVGADAPSMSSLDSSGDSLGDDAALPGGDRAGEETPD